MKSLSICVAGLCFVCGAFAETPRIAEYCAKILDDSTYVPLLIKDLDEPIKEWNYPDSIPCEHTPCRAKWKTESKVFFPFDIECREDGLVGLLGGGGGGISTCFHCRKHPIKLERVWKIKLYGSEDENACCRRSEDYEDKATFYLRNARESLKPFYGQVFKGRWKGEWDTNGNGDFPPMKRDFFSRLVGECNDTIPVVEYCVAGGKNAELHLTNYYDVLPKLTFADGKKMKCEGAMRVEKSYEMDFAEYGKRMLTHFVEQDTCNATSVIATKVYLPIPKYIGADALKGIPAKKLYGKNIPVMSRNVLTCNYDTIERNVLLYARIGGKCTKHDLQEKKKQNIFELEQVEDVLLHTKSIVGHWENCGDGYICPAKCIEVKDLLP